MQNVFSQITFDFSDWRIRCICTLFIPVMQVLELTAHIGLITIILLLGEEVFERFNMNFI